MAQSVTYGIPSKAREDVASTIMPMISTGASLEDAQVPKAEVKDR